MRDNLVNIIRMGLWGIPGFLIGLVLNYLLHGILDIDLYFSYVIVLLSISTINYFVINEIVFKGEKENNKGKRVAGYGIVVFVSKVGEWLCYSLFAGIWGFNYLMVQIIVNVFFLMFKFFLLKQIMR